MKIKNKINFYRRIITKALTKNIGKSTSDKKIETKDGLKINTVLISRPNHRLGNMLLITPIVQEVIEMFPNCKIHLFVKGNIAPIIFQNYYNIEKLIVLPKKHFRSIPTYLYGWISILFTQYDLAINVTKKSSSGSLSTVLSRSNYKLLGDTTMGKGKSCEIELHIAKYPVCQLRSFLDINQRLSKPIPLLDLKLSSEELYKGEKLLSKIINAKQKTICIFTFATGHKCYSEYWWESFYKMLKLTFPQYNILEILPVENVSQIAFAAPSFYSRNIREIASVIANTSLFIGADSGMMHLASAVKVPTIGLFSNCNTAVYHPYGNHSKAIDTNKNTVDHWIAQISDTLQSEAVSK